MWREGPDSVPCMNCHLLKDNFKSIFLLTRFRGNLEVFIIWKENSQFAYISEGKARLTLVHNFTNHAGLPVKFMWHIFGLIYIVCHKRPFKVSIWPAKIITWSPKETKKKGCKLTKVGKIIKTGDFPSTFTCQTIYFLIVVN